MSKKRYQKVITAYRIRGCLPDYIVSLTEIWLVRSPGCVGKKRGNREQRSSGQDGRKPLGVRGGWTEASYATRREGVRLPSRSGYERFGQHLVPTFDPPSLRANDHPSPIARKSVAS